MSDLLQTMFEAAQMAYPDEIRGGTSRWQLVDGYEVSGYNPTHKGKLVLQEKRKGCRTPFRHWGFSLMIKDLSND